jgi:hypothetical protein
VFVLCLFLCRDGSPSEKADALKAQLVASIGSQNIVMYGVEGVREVTAAIMAGVSFVATGNLAAPLAGSMAAQVRRACTCNTCICWWLVAGGLVLTAFAKRVRSGFVRCVWVFVFREGCRLVLHGCCCTLPSPALVACFAANAR